VTLVSNVVSYGINADVKQNKPASI